MTMIARWREFREKRSRFCSCGRDPFFVLAGEFLPADSRAVVVDVGPGNGRFADLLDLGHRFARVHLLEGNPSTVQALSGRYPGAALYRCPDPLPFADGEVAYLHCSHMIEHLDSTQFMQFLRECDRVLVGGGVLVFSTPLLWDRFYEDLSHVKPYGPGVFSSYLCIGGDERSADPISLNYRVERLVYRLALRPYLADAGLGSRRLPVDLMVQAVKKAVSVLGFGRYERTGYTIVLRKGLAAAAATAH